MLKKLLATIERFNEAAEWLAEKAFEERSANKVSLQQSMMTICGRNSVFLRKWPSDASP